MRLLIASLLLLSPLAAHASNVDFKCEGADYAFAIGGTIRLGANAHIDMEERNGFPGIYLVGAALDEGKAAGKSVEFVSEPDKTANDTIATLDMPSDYEAKRTVLAKLVLRYKSPETLKPVALKYNLKCTRQ
jgi:hypothetical protein